METHAILCRSWLIRRRRPVLSHLTAAMIGFWTVRICSQWAKLLQDSRIDQAIGLRYTVPRKPPWAARGP